MADFEPVNIKNLSPRQFRGMVRNVRNVYEAATPEQHEEGRLWYPKAHDVASVIGGGNVHRGAGAIAALSPQTDWDLNVQQAHELKHLGTQHIDALTRGDRSVLHGTALNRQTTARVLGAHRLLHGEDDPANSLGLKTGSFYRNISDPSDRHSVTIDVHAHDVAVGQKLQHNVTRGLQAQGRYNMFADAYRMAAQHHDVPGHQMQAATWVAWREANSRKRGSR
jgi:hypothetical protein